MQTFSRVLVGTISAICLLVLHAGPASATPHASNMVSGIASQSDPQEAAPTLSGPRRIDAKSVWLDYNVSGTITVGVELYDPYQPQYDDLGQWVSFSLGKPDYVNDAETSYSGSSCSAGYPPNQLAGGGSGELYLSSSLFIFTMVGFDGQATGMSTWNASKTILTGTLTHSALANRDYSCASFDLYGTRRADALDLYSRYSESCNCWYKGYILDDIDGIAYFPGKAPACDDGIDNDGDGLIDYGKDPDCSAGKQTSSEISTKPPCSDNQDNDKDGKSDLADPGCKGNKLGKTEIDPKPVRSIFKLWVSSKKCVINTEVEVLPDLTPLKVFPFSRVTIKVKGKKSVTRRLPLGTEKGYSFRLPKGNYKVSAWYPGDPWRLKSRVVHRSVTVKC